MRESKNPNYLKVVAKAFHLLEAMPEAGSSVSLSRLARQLQQPKATTFRILYTLQELGYVQQDHVKGTYQLGERISWFARNKTREAIKSAARPWMEHLLSSFEQTVNLGVMDRERVLYVEILEGLRTIRLAATINTYAPLHSTALGKSLLAFLEPHDAELALQKHSLTRFTKKTITVIPNLMNHLKQVRKQGFAIDNEETELGARCIAAPLRDSTGKPIAAISVSGPTSHVRGVRRREIAQAVLDASQKISEQLGFATARRD